MTALRLSARHRLRIAINSACCSHVESVGFDGQSMLATLATHAPRNSRARGGGEAVCASAFCADRTTAKTVATTRALEIPLGHIVNTILADVVGLTPNVVAIRRSGRA